MNFIRIILFSVCLTFIFDEGYILAQTDQSSSPKSSLKAKKKKRLKKRKKKTPRLILKKFSRDSLRIEQAFKKELLNKLSVPLNRDLKGLSLSFFIEG